jgi:hypothetical protein
MSKKIEKVIIVVRGGVAEVLKKSNNVEVEIRDYDCDGTDKHTYKDKDGDLYIKGIYSNIVKKLKHQVRNF